MLGVADGTFQKSLGSTKLSTQVFNAGPAAIEALNAGAIDAAFLGPSPAINAFVKSNGSSLRVVAGGDRERRLARRQAGHHLGGRAQG